MLRIPNALILHFELQNVISLCSFHIIFLVDSFHIFYALDTIRVGVCVFLVSLSLSHVFYISLVSLLFSSRSFFAIKNTAHAHTFNYEEKNGNKKKEFFLFVSFSRVYSQRTAE